MIQPLTLRKQPRPTAARGAWRRGLWVLAAAAALSTGCMGPKAVSKYTVCPGTGCGDPTHGHAVSPANSYTGVYPVAHPEDALAAGTAVQPSVLPTQTTPAAPTQPPQGTYLARRPEIPETTPAPYLGPRRLVKGQSPAAPPVPHQAAAPQAVRGQNTFVPAPQIVPRPAPTPQPTFETFDPYAADFGQAAASIPASQPTIYRGQQPGVLPPPGPVAVPAPPPPGGAFSGAAPGGPMFGSGPAYTDLDAYVQETQTGKLMFGLGINSDAGLIGNIVIDEQNFDWRRLPRGWEDFRNGTAFRGAGQKFRIELAPGTQVQRYMVDFQEPYLFDTPLNFGIGAFYYTRFFSDWTEGRTGGRFSLGYAFTPDLVGSLGLRIENINISNPRIPSPPPLAEAVGNNFLFSIRPRIAHDTRDNTFLPTQGHLIDLAFEQAFGSFTFPKVTLTGQQFFMLRERPDGSGRHTLSLIGRFGMSGSDTPIYERFFAGGYSTMRGFQFRGASPVEQGVIVGGDFQAIGTVEYMFPITADDAFKVVAFVDFGTVEQTSNIDLANFRVSPGMGLRINIPALGPAPLAIDFSSPVARADTDSIQVIQFFMGFGR